MKPFATIEGIIADARHAAPDCHTRKPVATRECLPTDACHAVGDGYARKPVATREGKITDAHHAVTDCHTRKPAAIIEGRLAEARHTVRDCHARKPAATIEGIIADARYGFCVIFGRNNNFRVRTSAYTRHGIAGSVAVPRIFKAFACTFGSATGAYAALIIMSQGFSVFCVTFFAHRLFGTGCSSAMAVFRFGMFVVERTNPCMRIFTFIFYPFSEVVSIWIYCNRQIVKRCFRFVFVILKYFVTNRAFVMRFRARCRASRLYL